MTQEPHRESQYEICNDGIGENHSWSETTPGRIMTAAEVAGHLQIPLVTLYRLVHKRQIPAFKIGGEIRFHRDAIEKWMTDRQAKR